MPIGLFQCGIDGRLLSVNARVPGGARPRVDRRDLRAPGVADFVAELADARSTIQDALAAGGRVPEMRVALQRKDGERVAGDPRCTAGAIRGRLGGIPRRHPAGDVTRTVAVARQVCENQPAEPACRPSI